MNCLEFRRLAQAAPHHLTSLAQTHVETCVACQDFIARMRQVDDAVLKTLSDVAVPDGLAERILLHSAPQQTRPWAQWAFAASVLLGLVIALSTYRTDVSFARAALAHVDEEAYTLSAQQQVAAPAIEEALASVGARLHGDIGQVTYLGSCPLPGGEGKHLVVSSPYGRFSLILMPAQIRQRKSAQGAKHAAIAKPAAHGTYAIVGHPSPDLLKIEKLLDQNVIW